METKTFENSQKKERSLKDFVDILVPKLWIVLIVAVVFAGLAFLFSYTRTDTYTSSARFLVEADPEEVGSSSLYLNEIAQNKIKNYEVIFDGSDFQKSVVDKLKAEYNIEITTAQFSSCYSFSKSSDVPVFTVKVTHTDEDVAYKIATVTRECIFRTINNMEGTEGLIEEIDPPSVPVKNSRNELRNALIAFLIGAVLSAAVILVIALADVTIRDKKKIEDNFDIPILGVIPYHEISKEQTGGGYYGGHGKDATV